MRYFGINKKEYSLEAKPFSVGGEGKLYKITSDTSKVAKIYLSSAMSSDIEEKIKYMVSNPPHMDILTQVAWPVDALYNEADQFCGFVMNNLRDENTVSLSDIYVYPPVLNISFKQKLIIAQNICFVINRIHGAGYVFGDFNPRNIGVNIRTGIVSFFDTDSYHILNKTSKKLYRCKVCAPGYVAPELIIKCKEYVAKHPEDKSRVYEKLTTSSFTKETDLFALAIHIHKLLSNGFTPFNGVRDSVKGSVPSPGVNDEAVLKDNYCYKPGNKPLSVAVPELMVHTATIQGLFCRTFIEGRKDPYRRVASEVWYKALLSYEKELVSCKNNKLHQYRTGQKECPWCAADLRFNRKITRPNTNSHPVQIPVKQPVPTPVPVKPVAPVASSQATSSKTVCPAKNVTNTNIPKAVPVSAHSVQNNPTSKASTAATQTKAVVSKSKWDNLRSIYEGKKAYLIIIMLIHSVINMLLIMDYKVFKTITTLHWSVGACMFILPAIYFFFISDSEMYLYGDDSPTRWWSTTVLSGYSVVMLLLTNTENIGIVLLLLVLMVAGYYTLGALLTSGSQLSIFSAISMIYIFFVGSYESARIIDNSGGETTFYGRILLLLPSVILMIFSIYRTWNEMNGKIKKESYYPGNVY